jgi:hypothetical protein
VSANACADVQPKPLQLFSDQRGGPRFLEAQLGMAMKIPAQLDKLRSDLLSLLHKGLVRMCFHLFHSSLAVGVYQQ